MHRTEARVRFGDTDPYGVVYFTSHLDYAKVALDEYLRRLGLPPSQFYRGDDGGWPIGEGSVRYGAPARYDELLSVTIWVADVGQHTVRFGFQIDRVGDRVRIAWGALTCVAIGPEWRARVIPPHLAALFERERAAAPSTDLQHEKAEEGDSATDS